MNNTRPEPVMNASYLAALLVSFVKVILAILIMQDVVQLVDGVDVLIVTGVTIAIDIAIVLVTMLRGARDKVTPLADPRDAEGVPLTRPDNSPAVTKAAK